MLQEIRQQPEALQRTIEEERQHAQQLRRSLPQNPPLVVLAARGTSDNAAQFGRYLIEITTGCPVSLAAPSVFTVYRSSLRLRGAIAVAISQSGESTDTNFVLERAAEAGAVTIGITNEPESTLARLAQHVLLVRAGREESIAATKTYTGQLAALYLLCYALGGAVSLDGVRRLPELAAAALELEDTVRELSARYTFMTRAVVIGRGLNYANAYEFALKLMETCSVVAERFSSADFLHGPIAMVDPMLPTFVFAPGGPTKPGVLDVLRRLAEINQQTLIITDQGSGVSSPLLLELSKKISQDDLQGDLWTPVPYIIPAQLFAACLAEHKQLNPDRPRMLSKVTQTL